MKSFFDSLFNTKDLREHIEDELERAKGFEPSTPTLARLCSTPELRPHEINL